MNEAYIRRLIFAKRPHAKFVVVSHTDQFLTPEAEIGRGFYYVSLYDENIGSNVFTSSAGPVMISNSYLSSFAYNLALAVLYEFENDIQPTDQKVSALLKYNFKKYFAEQLFHKSNTIFSRAILLETLVYEQFRMIPVFERIKEDSAFSRTATEASNIMGQLVMFHEMGHYYIDHNPRFWQELTDQFGKTFIPVLEEFKPLLSPTLLEECHCDIAAFYLSLIAANVADPDRQSFLRFTAFGYSCYATMFTLARSAEKTFKGNQGLVDLVDFQSTEKTSSDAGFEVDADREMILRAQLMLRLCERQANEWQVDLYGMNGRFPLPEDILLKLLNYVNYIQDPNDPQERGMALLLAEAFHTHPQGMEFLYLRSKVFQNTGAGS
ncbi:hypothetical protein [Hufsiella ginkgonis]|uniref:Uncharacterized protein n=1 Tax=Hufsiella ginkgonis TaxID=2695274 RepID=A0A7K1XU98_9SPHI|nr:hypothetical protein [Hufsiella ginkgonis]MXV14530.1 hypothetical protein [Hufsiella ginkgonis]